MYNTIRLDANTNAVVRNSTKKHTDLSRNFLEEDQKHEIPTATSGSQLVRTNLCISEDNPTTASDGDFGEI